MGRLPIRSSPSTRVKPPSPRRRKGLVALQGDASSEDLLRAANVEDASTVLVAPNRDDASVLISLTVRSLAPQVHLVAAAREEENVKLLYGAGADLVVAPSVSGGRLMGAAVRQRGAAVSGGSPLLWRRVGHGRADRAAGRSRTACLELPDLAGALILGAARGRERCPFTSSCFRLQPGDVIVYLTGDEGCARRMPNRSLQKRSLRRQRSGVGSSPVRRIRRCHQTTKVRSAGGRTSLGWNGNGGAPHGRRPYPGPGPAIFGLPIRSFSGPIGGRSL